MQEAALDGARPSQCAAHGGLLLQAKPRRSEQKVNVQSIRQNREERKRSRRQAAQGDQAVQVGPLDPEP